MNTHSKVSRLRLQWGVGALLLALGLGQPAHALVGVGTANPALAVAGAVTVGVAFALPVGVAATGCLVGYVAAASSGASVRGAEGTCLLIALPVGYFSLYPAAALLLAGIVVLPDSPQAVQLSSVSADELEQLRKAAGLNEAQLEAFQDERSELEALAQDVGQSLWARARASKLPFEEISASQWMEWSRAEWLSRREVVSDDAFSALSAIAGLSLARGHQ